MKTIIKFFTYGVLIFHLAFTSCSKDGAVGPVGPTGTMGVNGMDGNDGTNGIDGNNGTDGNANVETTIFTNPSWSPTSNMELSVPSITQDAIDNYLILAFLKGGSFWYSSDANHSAFGYFRGIYEVEKYTITAFDPDGRFTANPPDITLAKVIVIEPSNVIVKSGNGKNANTPSNFRKNTLAKMVAAGVDIKDYDAVTKYLNSIE